MSEDIKAHIGVTPPYFALDNLLSQASHGISAHICAQHPTRLEAGPIAAAEVGRHLAILGSCALAEDNPVADKHYYIACKAELSRIDCPADLEPRRFEGRSRVISRSRTEGATEASLHCADGQLLYTLTTHYRIMRARVFERIYQDEKIDFQTRPGANPYASTFDYYDVRVQGPHLSARFGPIDPCQCDGHFTSFPFIPVAVLMQVLSQAAGELLGHRIGRAGARYRVIAADIEANSFAYTHERLTLMIDHVHGDADDRIFQCHAEASNRRIGTMTLTLRPVSADTRPNR